MIKNLKIMLYPVLYELNNLKKLLNINYLIKNIKKRLTNSLKNGQIMIQRYCFTISLYFKNGRYKKEIFKFFIISFLINYPYYFFYFLVEFFLKLLISCLKLFFLNIISFQMLSFNHFILKERYY